MILLIDSYASAIITGFYALFGITVGALSTIHQNRRKNIIVSGAGGYQGNYAAGGVGQPYQPPFYQPSIPYKAEAAGAPLLYNQMNIPRSPPTTHAALYTDGSSRGSVGYNATYRPLPSDSFNTRGGDAMGGYTRYAEVGRDPLVLPILDRSAIACQY